MGNSINEDKLYTAISFHDLRLNNKEKNHEITSGNIMFKDEFINKQKSIIKNTKNKRGRKLLKRLLLFYQ